MVSSTLFVHLHFTKDKCHRGLLITCLTSTQELNGTVFTLISSTGVECSAVALTRQGILAEGSGVHGGGRLRHVLCGWGLGRTRMHGHEL